MGFFGTVKKKVENAAYYYGPKVKAAASNAGSYLRERGYEMHDSMHERSESPAWERYEHRGGRDERHERHLPKQMPRKSVPSRVPRKSQPPGYDGSMDMFGGGGMGMGGGGDLFGVSNYGTPSKRRKQNSKRARTFRGFKEENDSSDYLGDMF